MVAAPPLAALIPVTDEPAKPAAPSHLVLPVSVPFDELVARLDALIPKTAQEGWTKVTKDGETPTVEVKYEVWRDPIKASLRGQTLDITVPLHYAADFRAKVKNPLGGSVWITKGDTWGTPREPQHITATVHTKLGVSSAWQISADSKLDPLVHGPAPSGKVCVDAILKACVQKAELAPMIRKRLDGYLVPRIEKGLGGADAQVEQAFALKKHAADLWAALQQPQSLAPVARNHCPTELDAVCKQPAWLIVSPRGVGVSPLELEHGDAKIEVSMLGGIAVVVGARPSVKVSPLPALQTIEAPAGVHVAATLQIPMAALSESLGQRLAGVQLVGHGEQLAVRAVKVQSAADAKQPHRLAVQLAMTGAVQADISLFGDVTYDAASQSLTVSRFDYTLETQDQLVKQLESANHDAFRKELAGKARVELKGQAGLLEQAIAQALQGILGKQLDVEGELSKIEVQKIAVKSDVLALDLVLDGTLRAKVKPH